MVSDYRYLHQLLHLRLSSQRLHAIVIDWFAGNGNGTFGYTLSAGKYGKNAASIRAAVNKTGLRLLTIPLHENRTVYHDFFTQFGRTRIIVRQAGGWGARGFSSKEKNPESSKLFFDSEKWNFFHLFVCKMTGFIFISNAWIRIPAPIWIRTGIPYPSLFTPYRYHYQMEINVKFFLKTLHILFYEKK